MVSKKKSMANKLAKMSDEERARYLQHRADIEEEARRRKEQLISTFLKNKLKKEEAFARLNVAKINQHWHQILRKAKCKEMKENAQHMKEWIERAVSLKDRTIALLLEELDEAEYQYGNNFKAHLLQIDAILERNAVDLKEMQAQFEQDRDLLLETHSKEQDSTRKRFSQEMQHLRTVQYGQSTQFENFRKEQREYYIKKQNEAVSNYEDELRSMKKRLEENIYEIWTKIAQVIKNYVLQTDKRRLHFAELLRLDKEGFVEIKQNQLQILQEEEILINLQKEYEFLMLERKENILALELHLKELSKVFNCLRRQLRKDLSKDEKQLKVLVEISNGTVKFLQDLLKRGENIIFLANSCQKLEKEEEIIKRRFPLRFPDTFDDDFQEKIARSRQDSISVELTKEPKGKSKQLRQQSTLKDISFDFEDDDDDDKSKIDFLVSFDCLKDLENFWSVFNGVEVEFLELQQEKKVLIEENKNLRGMMRSILEAEALSKSIPESRISTRICSRAIQSATVTLF